MVQDKLQEERTQSPFDRLVSYGTAAIGIGVGAAVFNKNGGLKHVANVGSILKRATDDLTEDIAGLDWDNLRTSDAKQILKKAFKDPSHGFQEARRFVNSADYRAGLRVDGSRGAFSVFRQLDNAHVNLKAMQKRWYDTENVIKPIANKYNDLYKFKDSENKVKLEQLIQTMNERAANKMAIYAKADSSGIAKLLGGKKEIDRIFEELKSVKSQKDKEFVFNKEFDEKIRKDLMDKSYDISSLEKTLGSRRQKNKLGEKNKDYVTIGEFMDSYEDQFKKTQLARKVEGQSSTESIDALAFLKEVREKMEKQGDDALERFNDLYLDRGMYRKDKHGKIYSLKDTSDILARPMDEFGASMPGKILKYFDMKKRREQPAFHEFSAGPDTRDHVLAALVGRDNSSIVKNYLRIHDRTYEVADDSLKHVAALDDTYLISRRNGTLNTLMSDMTGQQGYRKTNSAIKNWLDLGRTTDLTFADMPGNIAAYAKSNQNPRYAVEQILKTDNNTFERLDTLKESYKAIENNIVSAKSHNAGEEVMDMLYENKEQVLDELTGHVERARTVYKFYNQNAKATSKDSITRMLSSDALPKESKDMLAMLKMSDEDLLQEIIANPKKFSDSVKNDNLAETVKRYLNNPKTATDSVTIKNAEDMTGVIFGAQNRSSTYMDGLRLEIEKEAHMHLASHVRKEDGKIDMDAITDLFDNIGGSEKQKRNLQFNLDFSVFQMTTGVSKDATDGKSVIDSVDMAEEAMRLFAGRKLDEERNVMSSRLVEEVHNKTKRFATSYDLHMQGEDIVEPMNGASWGHMRKAISPLDLINNINDETVRKSFFKQFTAGRKNMQDVTSATMVPYFFLNRLNDPLGKIGLALSSEFTGSSTDLMRGIIMKRALPIAAGITGYEYLDDMQKAVTGTGITESFLINAANVDLGVRKTADMLGMSDWLKNERQINPIAQYMFGDDYMDYDERKDYYQNGYTAMRKGRWWSFGSLNEFRGSQVQYWQPNALRRATSDYKDAALYDGFFDKWSHSLMPTPTDPLSPLRAILDPYWLENRFSEERPYPITGKMFTEETPWGPLLNATVGNIIKPQRLMHQDRLGSNMVDVRAIIERKNQETMERANGDNRHLARVKDGAIEAVNFTNYDAPTPSQRIVHVDQMGGDVNITAAGYGAFSGVTAAGDYMSGKAEYDADNPAPSGGSGGGFVSGLIGGATAKLTTANSPTALLDQNGSERGVSGALIGALSQSGGGSLSFADRIEIESADGNIFAKALNMIGGRTEGSIGIIEDMNYQTLMSTRSYRPSNSHVKERGTVTTESIYKAGARFGDGVMDNEQALSDLRGLSNSDDMIGELAYSARFITGIYGYGTFLGIGGQAKNKLSDASDMTSPIRSFWDANLGGVGGNYFEIFRRFVPSNNFLENNFNPLMNKMPDWMPDKYRFGDPYCVSKDTVIEKGRLEFITAEEVEEKEVVTTHKGNLKQVDAIAIRDVKEGEDVYKITVATLPAVPMKVSEDHPILTVKNPSQRRQYKPVLETKTYAHANIMIDAMKSGITRKRDLASLAGLSMDKAYTVFKKMVTDGIIKDNTVDKWNLVPIRLERYEEDMIVRGLQWTKAKDLKVGDYTAYPLPRYSKQDITLDIGALTNYPYTDNYVYCSGTMKLGSDVPVIYEWLESLGEVPVFKRGERKQLLLKNEWNAKHYESAVQLFKKGQSPERVNRFVLLTENIASLFGLYLAEGSMSKTSVHMAHHESESHLFEAALLGAKEIHPSCNGKFFKRNEDGHGAQSVIYSSVVLQVIKSLFGTLAHHKSIPDFFMDAQDDILIHLLKYYFEGDGNSLNDNCKNKHSDNNVYRLNLTSVNLNILLQIRKLLLRFGVVASIQSKGNPKETVLKNGQIIKGGKAYVLCLRGTQGVKIGKLFGYTDMDYEGERSSSHSFMDDKYVYLRVNKIEKDETVKQVWGFDVGQDNSFCVAGVATHNTALPKGEMRMPGRGYESLNELHPDQYGTYGSFDRYKILADISPGSSEYKVWRDIAKETVRDPELKKQMEQIDARVKKQNEKYDFFDYRFAGQHVARDKAVISEVIDNNTFRVVGDDRTFKLAGVNVTNQNSKDPNASRPDGDNALSQYLTAGASVTLVTDKNQYNGVDEVSGAVNAAVFVGGESVSRNLLKEGFAERRLDMSAAGTEALYTGSQIARGKAFEMIAHLPIPLYQQKFMKIRDPLESYKQEMVYGTSYTSWNRPIDSILKPAFERSLMSDTEFFVGAAAATANFYVHKYSGMKELKQGSNILMALTNRGAFIGGFLAKGVGANTTQARAAAFLGAGAQAIGYAYTRDDQPIQEGLLGATVGLGAGHLFNKDIGKGKGAAVGAAAGFLLGGLNTSALSDDDFGFGNKYIPKRTKENWEMTEYYDRLEYLKYSGMFNKAAKLAKRKESVNIKKLVEDYDAQREENRKANEQLSQYREIVMRAYGDNSARKEHLLSEIDSKMNVLKESEFNLAVGDYGKSALIYKQAMDSTIYGLKADANWSQIVRATPTAERDHFMAFMKISDPKKRKEILKVVSPYEAKVLKTAWGMEQDKQESNDSYFMKHKLPGTTWEGWRPDKKLSDIQVKTIANEGRLLSDFGYFESQLRDPDVIHAQQASPNNPSNGLIQTQLAITSALKGYGLMGVNVNVEPKKESGMDVVMNFTKMAKYDLGSAVTSIF